MKFKFRFESILKIRRHEEKKEKQKLGALLAKQAHVEKAIDDFLQKAEAFEGAVSKSELNSLDKIRSRYEQIHRIQNSIWRLESGHKKLAEDIKVQRGKLMEANKQTRILEKLETREKTKFIQHQQHLEQMQQNEIATQMYNRLH